MEVRSLRWLLDFKDNASKQIQKVNGSIEESLAKVKKLGESSGEFGKTLSKRVTAPLVALGTKAIHSVTGFDDGMSKVRSLTGATGEDFDRLREKAIQLGNDTAFSAIEASEGMQVLAASGMGVNDILNISSEMFSLMSAGSTDANTASSVLTNTMAQFNLTAKDGQRIADTFAQGSASAKLGVEDLEYIMSQAGGSLASMNMTMEESVAVAGQLANAGMPIGTVGTSINAMSREIKANSDKFAEIGISVYDSTGKLRTMGEVMGDLEKKLEGTTDAQRDQILSSVFSGQAMESATKYLSLGTEAYQDLTEEINNAEGASQRMADMNEDNIGGAFRSLASSMGTLMIRLGDVFKGPVKSLAGFIERLVGKFNELSPAMQTVVGVIMAFTASIGPAILVFSKLTTMMFALPATLANVKAGLLGLKTVLGLFKAFTLHPYSLAIIALISVTYLLIKNWDKVKSAFISVTNVIVSVSKAVVDFLKFLWSGIVWYVKKQVQFAIDVIVIPFKALVGIFKNIIGLIGALFRGDWSAVWEHAKGIVQNYMDFIYALPKLMFQAGKDMMQGLWRGIKSVGGWVGKKISGIFGRDTFDDMPKADGSHKTGLSRVPFDGYRAVLHKDEEVLTKNDPRNRNSNGSLSGVSFNPNININIEGNASSQTVGDIERAVQNQMNLMFKKLSMKRGVMA